MGNYKELGGGAMALFLSLAIAFHKYLKIQLDSVYKKIKEEADADELEISGLKKGLSDNTEEIKEIQRRLDSIKKMEDDLKLIQINLDEQMAKLTENSHKLQLSGVQQETLKGILEDTVQDVKRVVSEFHKIEVGFAKMLGTMSRSID